MSKTCFPFFLLHGAFIADGCEETGKLILAEAKHFKAKYVVVGKRRRRLMKLPYVHSVSTHVVKHRQRVFVFKILEGWKSGKPDKQAATLSRQSQDRHRSPQEVRCCR